MPGESKLSTASHIAQIVGLIPSAICAWDVLTRNGQQTAAGSVVSQPMSKTLLVSLACAITCFLIGGILQVVVMIQRRHKPLTYAPPETGNPNGMTDEQWKQHCEAVASQNRLIELGRSVDGMFTPLQTDALRLAKNIDTLLEELPVPQKTDYAAYNVERGVFNTTNDVHIWGNAARAVNEKLRARYVLDLQATAKNVHLRFVADGNNNRHLGNLADTAHNEDGLKDLAKTLRVMALGIETSNEA